MGNNFRRMPQELENKISSHFETGDWRVDDSGAIGLRDEDNAFWYGGGDPNRYIRAEFDGETGVLVGYHWAYEFFPVR